MLPIQTHTCKSKETKKMDSLLAIKGKREISQVTNGRNEKKGTSIHVN